MVADISCVIPMQASKEATATGATFHSDGGVLIIRLIPAAAVAQ